MIFVLCNIYFNKKKKAILPIKISIFILKKGKYLSMNITTDKYKNANIINLRIFFSCGIKDSAESVESGVDKSFIFNIQQNKEIVPREIVCGQISNVNKFKRP